MKLARPQSGIRIACLSIVLQLASLEVSHSTATFCAVTERTSDGYVSLREGPTPQNRKLGEVLPSNLLIMATEQCRSDFGTQQCDPTGRWIFVEKVFPIGHHGSAQKGWILASLTRQIAYEGE
jgi:hypothetical protein